jgi:hypothetical protein
MSRASNDRRKRHIDATTTEDSNDLSGDLAAAADLAQQDLDVDAMHRALTDADDNTGESSPSKRIRVLDDDNTAVSDSSSSSSSSSSSDGGVDSDEQQAQSQASGEAEAGEGVVTPSAAVIATTVPHPYSSGPVSPHQAYELFKLYFEHSARTKANVKPFLDFPYKSVWALATEKDTTTGEEKFCFHCTPGYEFVNLLLPVGVLSYSKLTYHGNLYETGDRAPKSDEDVKVSIDWSPRKFDPDHVADDGIHDATAVKVVNKLLEMNDWFTEAMFDMEPGSKLCQKWCNLARKQVMDRFKRNPKGPDGKPRKPYTKDELTAEAKEEFTLSMLYSIFKESPTHHWIRASFGTKLLKRVTPKMEEYLAKNPYVPPRGQRHLAIAWHTKHLILNFFNFYVVKSPSELSGPDGWNKEMGLLKKVDRDDVAVMDGDLGCPIISIGPGPAGSTQIGLLAFLTGLIWVRRGTPLSLQMHDNGPVPAHVAEVAALPPPSFGPEFVYTPAYQKAGLKGVNSEDIVARFKALAGAEQPASSSSALPAPPRQQVKQQQPRLPPARIEPLVDEPN